MSPSLLLPGRYVPAKSPSRKGVLLQQASYGFSFSFMSMLTLLLKDFSSSYLMMLSGMWMQSMGIRPLSSDKLVTYLILLLNLELIKGRVTAKIVLMNQDG